jgi:uncharacterized membrane protein
MNLSVTVDIQATTDLVWRVLCDVERWPDWTPSVTSIQRLSAGPLIVGSRARVRQPKLLPATWRVTELEQNRSFTWVAATPGTRMIAGHRVEPRAGGSRVTLSIVFGGIFGPLLGRLTRSLTERYIQMEANGLKARSEELQRKAATLRSVSA